MDICRVKEKMYMDGVGVTDVYLYQQFLFYYLHLTYSTLIPYLNHMSNLSDTYFNGLGTGPLTRKDFQTSPKFYDHYT